MNSKLVGFLINGVITARRVNGLPVSGRMYILPGPSYTVFLIIILVYSIREFAEDVRRRGHRRAMVLQSPDNAKDLVKS